MHLPVLPLNLLQSGSLLIHTAKPGEAEREQRQERRGIEAPRRRRRSPPPYKARARRSDRPSGPGATRPTGNSWSTMVCKASRLAAAAVPVDPAGRWPSIPSRHGPNPRARGSRVNGPSQPRHHRRRHRHRRPWVRHRRRPTHPPPPAASALLPCRPATRCPTCSWTRWWAARSRRAACARCLLARRCAPKAARARTGLPVVSPKAAARRGRTGV